MGKYFSLVFIIYYREEDVVSMKRIWLFICVIALVAALSITAIAVFADTDAKVATDAYTKVKSDTEVKKSETDIRVKPQLTEEQKAEFKAKREEMKAKCKAQKEKWDGLTDAQKNEIYGLVDQKDALEKQITDKYLEYGVIDQDTANNIKNRLSERSAKLREGGRIPGMGGFFKGKKK
jgi:hypothetical protein